MSFFESLLLLLLCAIVLLQVARLTSLPYPAMLATAGMLLALVPGVPQVPIEPSVSLALFIAPALVDAAFDFPAGNLRRYMTPLLLFAVVAVLLTALSVAGVTHTLLGIPWAACLVLGAVVAPPDAAAATATLRGLRIPVSADVVLKGESLFNDAVSLLLFTAGLEILSRHHVSAVTGVRLLVAAPGGILLGMAWAYLVGRLNRYTRQTLGGNLLQFVLTYLVWFSAEHLSLSPVLCVIAFAMTLARSMDPTALDARMRVQSYAVWSSVVFTLNVLAFLVMGMQAKSLVETMPGPELRSALKFAAIVCLTVILTRLLFVIGFNRLRALWLRRRGSTQEPPLAVAILSGWSGMRGFVSIATALALPASFPRRDVAVLTAFSVVIVTLVLQGLTLRPLISLLRLDRSVEVEEGVELARESMARAALNSLAEEQGEQAESFRARLQLKLRLRSDPQACREFTQLRELGLRALRAERTQLETLRADEAIGADEYLSLQEQLDWWELTLVTDDNRRIEEI